MFKKLQRHGEYKKSGKTLSGVCMFNSEEEREKKYLKK